MRIQILKLNEMYNLQEFLETPFISLKYRILNNYSVIAWLNTDLFADLFQINQEPISGFLYAFFPPNWKG